MELMYSRMERLKERERLEEQRRRHEMWVHGKILWHGMQRNKSIPPTSEAEQKKKPNYKAAQDYADWRDDHDEKIDKAFGDRGHPYHFESFAMFGQHLFDEPPEPKTKTPEEKRQEILDRLNTMWDGPVAKGTPDD